MNQSMINSAVTMGQLQLKLDTTGNNLANVNTTGFKRSDTSFADLLFQQVNNQSAANQEVGRLTPNGIRVGSGAAVAQTAVRFEQGSISQSGREFDVALTEPGYFFELAETPGGDRQFTRDGAFYLSPNPNNNTQNFLVNSQGDYVLSAAGEPIELPSSYDDFQINEEGAITVTLNDGTLVDAGQLQLVNITKPQLLASIGENNYVLPDLDALDTDLADVLEEAAGAQVFMQSALETSNVDSAKEMTDMMEAQRSYQFNSKAISITDQMMGLVTNLR
ncbi:flagellar biosynthesis protein FlgG [Salipaludibacillus neizhouensis]|uniref:Flagellar biosynthesis protein FlgG n=1 Tax=Salipaludibacillus neizhouensis TaxID=885475 RepID=A0A3A9K621_9BACI|nr:flagellar hook-basal body protein [Salipaludibacillus neizhouensis]RKL68027.1 flagellar biosynthesis protein FlgG [Salipaludibacillus neizhouensis]